MVARRASSAQPRRTKPAWEEALAEDARLFLRQTAIVAVIQFMEERAEARAEAFAAHHLIDIAPAMALAVKAWPQCLMEPQADRHSMGQSRLLGFAAAGALAANRISARRRPEGRAGSPAAAGVGAVILSAQGMPQPAVREAVALSS